MPYVCLPSSTAVQFLRAYRSTAFFTWIRVCHIELKCEAILQPMRREVHVTYCKADLQNQQARDATASILPACTPLLA